MSHRSASTISRVSRVREREQRSALVVASLALFGLFAMHGWGLHGTGHEDNAPAMMASICSGHAADHCQPEPQPIVPAGDHGLMGLCLAVLGGLAAVGVTLVQLRRFQSTHQLERLPLTLASRSVRERDPPNLLALGVIRC